jgi:hypothetical protein
MTEYPPGTKIRFLMGSHNGDYATVIKFVKDGFYLVKFEDGEEKEMPGWTFEEVKDKQ